VGYAARKGKTLLATDKGVRLIEIMPPEIASPELTGKWELALHEITDGKQDAALFLSGINRMCSFLVDYARNNRTAVSFPPEERSRGKSSGRKSSGISGAVLEGTVCPLCGKGKLRESPQAFSCTEQKCNCTVWKDILVRGGGPELNEKLMRLILEKKEVRGSTGIIILQNGFLKFYRDGQEAPAVNRSLVYVKK
jgi:DNA topoisomerase-3